MERIKIGISRCLLGDKVRYDGGHKHDPFVTDTLGQFFDLVPVCPEVEYGLPVPREAMKLVGRTKEPQLVTVKTGIDHTDGMLKWAGKRLKELEREDLCGFIFKSKSPSSGIKDVRVYTARGREGRRGVGIFAGAFMRYFPLIPVEDDEGFHNPRLRDNFIEKVFVLKRWREFLKKGKSMKDLVDFHRDHKILMLAHSPAHYRMLDKIIADSKDHRKDMRQAYIETMMEGLSEGSRLIGTVASLWNE